MLDSAWRGLMAGATAFAVGGALFVLLQGMEQRVRAASCGAIALIVAVLMLMVLPGGGGMGSSKGDSGPNP